MPLMLIFDDGDPVEPVSSGTETIYYYLLEIVCTESLGIKSIHGLVLSPVGDQRGQYVRVAYFKVYKLSGTTNYEVLHHAFQKSRLAETLYLESHDDHTYTIEII
jgi:hypothetical protein